MFSIHRYINTPVPSNTYIIVDGEHCLVIDPGSKEESELIVYINEKGLTVDYILLTHEHFDHYLGDVYKH